MNDTVLLLACLTLMAGITFVAYAVLARAARAEVDES